MVPTSLSERSFKFGISVSFALAAAGTHLASFLPSGVVNYQPGGAYVHRALSHVGGDGVPALHRAVASDGDSGEPAGQQRHHQVRRPSHCASEWSCLATADGVPKYRPYRCLGSSQLGAVSTHSLGSHLMASYRYWTWRIGPHGRCVTKSQPRKPSCLGAEMLPPPSPGANPDPNLNAGNCHGGG